MKVTDQEKTILAMIEQDILRIDDDGKIWKVKKKHKEWDGYRDCKPRLLGHENHGYLRLGLRDPEGKSIKAQAHRIVWMHHKGDIPDGLEVNHKDGVKSRNRISNLELLTPSEQNLHAVHVLGRKMGNHTHVARHFKLTEKDVKYILQLLAEGKTQRQVAKQFNVTQARISQIKIRRIS